MKTLIYLVLSVFFLLNSPAVTNPDVWKSGLSDRALKLASSEKRISNTASPESNAIIQERLTTQ